ncbi:carboxymuconolactone decarboxylase family protein [Tsukamurella pseudospumae]
MARTGHPLRQTRHHLPGRGRAPSMLAMVTTIGRHALVTIAALTTLGDAERQLKFHTRAALTAGASPQDIVDAVIHLLAFAGNPRVFNAMLAIRQVFAERELLPLQQQ